MELIKQIDQTIFFNENTIRIVGTYDKPWFVAKDICELLDIKDNRSALRILPDKWKGEQNLLTLGGNQNMTIINEFGLYKIIMRSNKPNAAKFQEFVCEEILPSIRKTGEYKYQKILEEKNKLEEENKRIEKEKLELKEENKFLTEAHLEKNKEIKNLQNKVIQKQRIRKCEDRNCVYLVQDEHHKKERLYIIGKAIDLDCRLSSYNKTHDTEIIYYRSCNSAKQMNHIEKCVLTKLDRYRQVANRDRFILPENEDISLFTNVVDLFVDAFSDVDESVDIEKDLTEDEIKQRKMNARCEYYEDNPDYQPEYRKKYYDEHKDALNAYNKKYYEEHKDEHNDITAKYREEHSDEINENGRKYYEEHTKEFKEYKKEYYEKNKESVLERAKEYYIENKEIVLEKTKERYVENKDKILAYQSEKILCECGVILQRNYMAKHKRTEIHRLSLENKLSENPSQEVLKITCICGHEVRSNYMKRHLGSKIHEAGVKIQQKKINKIEIEVDNKQEVNKVEINNPVIECVCGTKLKLLSSKCKTHLNSKLHVKFIENQTNSR